MLQTFRNAWKIEEIRKKILFTLFMILLYRVGNAIPVPYVNVTLLGRYFTQLENTVLGLVNVMSGGAFSSATIFALSIQPYINASIIIQLLCIAIPALERFENGAEIDAQALLDAGVLSKCRYGVKVLGNGELTKSLTVKATAFSEGAKAKIEAAGGKAEVV